MSRRCRACLLNINWCLRCRDHWESHLKCRWKYFHGRVVWAWGRHELRQSCLLDAGNHLQRNHCEFGRTMCDSMCHVWMEVSWWSVEEEFSGEGVNAWASVAWSWRVCGCVMVVVTPFTWLYVTSRHLLWSQVPSMPPSQSLKTLRQCVQLLPHHFSPDWVRLNQKSRPLLVLVVHGLQNLPLSAYNANLLEPVTTPRYTGVHPYLCNECVDYDKTLA